MDTRGISRRRLLAGVGAAWPALSPAAEAPSSSPAADGESQLELEVKAAMVYYLARFVEWPSASGLARGPNFVIGVYGSLALAAAFERMVAGRRAFGKPVLARRLHRPREAEGCHVVFLAGERPPMEPVSALRGLPVLTIGEGAAFVERGGMIGLVLASRRFAFDVNLDPARDSGLVVSSKLLRLAREVRGQQP